MEREVGGGIGMGNTCKPMAFSIQCMTKSTTKKKKEHGLRNYQNFNANFSFALCQLYIPVCYLTFLCLSLNSFKVKITVFILKVYVD